MPRTVFRTRLKEELPGLATPPPSPAQWPGNIRVNFRTGLAGMAGIATMLINEKHLNMMDKEARKYLNEQRDKFLKDEDVDQAEGYAPPEEK